ncbi:hypothetical protein HAX54_003404 [Datura stramonium]|uniref:Uncharacterized protein n=1 Tax=Datura stramonium TaxID=4076 RepID=A0ABS8WS94_DATST|nr:hypothetical protein [Datura stramonium]
MESLHSDQSRRSEDSNKNVAYHRQHHHNEHMFGTAQTFSSPTRLSNEPSAFVDIINSVTRRLSPRNKGWLDGQDLDHNNLQLFYWFLAYSKLPKLYKLSILGFLPIPQTDDLTNTNPKSSGDNNNNNNNVNIVLPKSASVSRVPFLKADENDVTVEGSSAEETKENKTNLFN